MNIKFLSGFQSVGVIIILISVGYIITSLGKCDEKINKFISWFIITIAMPCNMFLNIVKHFSTEELSNIHQSVAIPAIAMVASLIAGGVLVHFLKVRKERAGTMAVLTALNNTIFMGMPVNQAFFEFNITQLYLLARNYEYTNSPEQNRIGMIII